MKRGKAEAESRHDFRQQSSIQLLGNQKGRGNTIHIHAHKGRLDHILISGQQHMAGAGRVPNEPLDQVSLNKIFCETVRKELRCQRLQTEYALNPLLNVHTITGKPMSWHDNLEEPADATFLKLIHHAALEPNKKYTEPQTESQEIGWFSTPLISTNRNDSRLYFPSRSTEITKYMAAMWRLKETSKDKR
ncbi:cilia- and flagella-associated protein 144 isoform X2 [Rhineura floridana]|uniref:cilia- and flagella-associated protein 144 isoform X2 n=1 Tax=Rhineura floridana TaxID=261503 RepID=UPI002AC88935|nr:cilia- and flagella-associated protein 144 isoform X2 [Rhineura floridana]